MCDSTCPRLNTDLDIGGLDVGEQAGLNAIAALLV